MRHVKECILLIAVLSLIFTASCGSGGLGGVYLDSSAPVLEFEPVKTSEDGKNEYYLFDDNPEHLNPNFLADSADAPSSIAHFEDLQPGIYTVFSYHHRGDSVDYQADLYYDAAFTAEEGGAFKILNIGLDHNWDWNQAWADYTNTPVLAPEYVQTFKCSCASDCGCRTGEDCYIPGCECIVRDERRDPKTALFDNIGAVKEVGSSDIVLLSDHISYISQNDINRFRYGGYDEPMWMMLKFEVVSGSVTLDTIAYQDKQTALNNIKTVMSPGKFEHEPQYKGIAQNAPIVEAELSYSVGDDAPSGRLPVTVKNMRVPDGLTLTDGRFATNVNTWREEDPIAAESDLMLIEYRDDSKLELYGAEAEGKDNIWRFDPYHTKIVESDERLEKYGIEPGDRFVPNDETSKLPYPTGYEKSTDEFYSDTACNLGNFGVTYRYRFNFENSGERERKFVFDMSSIAGQVYRFRQVDGSGNVVYSDEGNYIMKKFDYDPAEDPTSTSDPKERIDPYEMSSDIEFVLRPGSEYEIYVEITTLTGCTAPLHITLSLD